MAHFQLLAIKKMRTGNLPLSAHTPLFHFTRNDEARINRAIDEAKIFMQSFGAGQRPPMVDLRFYANNHSLTTKTSNKQ